MLMRCQNPMLILNPVFNQHGGANWILLLSYLFVLYLNFSSFQFSLKTAFRDLGNCLTIFSGQRAGSIHSTPTYFRLYLSPKPDSCKVLELPHPFHSRSIQSSLHSHGWIQLSFVANLIFKIPKRKSGLRNYLAIKTFPSDWPPRHF